MLAAAETPDLPAAVVSLRIDPDAVLARISPTFTGLMTEEINHSYDGGLYAELIRNRAFQDDPHRPVAWSMIDSAGGGAMALDASHPCTSALPVSLRLDAPRARPGFRVGIANAGWWGIAVRPATVYRARLDVCAPADGSGPLTVDLERADGSVLATATTPVLRSGWQRCLLTLQASAGIAGTGSARCVVSTEHAGTYGFGLVSLFPPTSHDRPNGNRIDVMEALADLGPAFLRFPGGNYLEGDSIADRFPWQRTLGDIAQRPGHAGCWGYRSSDGMGLYEFLTWAEDLGCEPVLAVYAGFSLPRGHAHDLVRAGPALAPYVQEALDEIQYVIGDVHTPWGARRAADGHAAPFPLHWVEIGNEDGFDLSGSYDGRFTQFRNAIHAAYPQLQLISTVDPHDKGHVVSCRPDAIDEHQYWTAAAFEQAAPSYFERWDRSGPKLFDGEWAAGEVQRPGGGASHAAQSTTSALRAALGDAAWMIAMERNADAVVMQCYAPLLARDDPGADRRWRPDLIAFDGRRVAGGPSYHAIAMLSRHHGDQVVAATLQGAVDAGGIAPLQLVASRDSHTGTLSIAMLNLGPIARTVAIALAGDDRWAPVGNAITLSGPLDETDTLDDPGRVVPIMHPLAGAGSAFRYTFPAGSLTILILPRL